MGSPTMEHAGLMLVKFPGENIFGSFTVIVSDISLVGPTQPRHYPLRGKAAVKGPPHEICGMWVGVQHKISLTNRKFLKIWKPVTAPLLSVPLPLVV